MLSPACLSTSTTGRSTCGNAYAKAPARSGDGTPSFRISSLDSTAIWPFDGQLPLDFARLLGELLIVGIDVDVPRSGRSRGSQYYPDGRASATCRQDWSICRGGRGYVLQPRPAAYHCWQTLTAPPEGGLRGTNCLRAMPSPWRCRPRACRDRSVPISTVRKWQSGSLPATSAATPAPPWSADQQSPKSSDLSAHSADDLDWVAAELNDRPRKRLGFTKPIEQIGP
jgi:hypothetical protein